MATALTRIDGMRILGEAMKVAAVFDRSESA
jgi:hypothetical protein